MVDIYWHKRIVPMFSCDDNQLKMMGVIHQNCQKKTWTTMQNKNAYIKFEKNAEHYLIYLILLVGQKQQQN